MSRSERIAGIARLVERAERDAAEALMGAKERMEQIEARLAELCRYREEYGAQMRRSQSAGLSITDLKRHQLFMRRLEEGVEHARASLTLFAEGHDPFRFLREVLVGPVHLVEVDDAGAELVHVGAEDHAPSRCRVSP